MNKKINKPISKELRKCGKKLMVELIILGASFVLTFIFFVKNHWICGSVATVFVVIFSVRSVVTLFHLWLQDANDDTFHLMVKKMP